MGIVTYGMEKCLSGVVRDDMEKCPAGVVRERVRRPQAGVVRDRMRKCWHCGQLSVRFCQARHGKKSWCPVDDDGGGRSDPVENEGLRSRY